MQNTSHSPTTHPSTQHDTARQWWVLIAVGLCLFLGSVDGSIVNVALPTLMQGFNADFPTVQWVVLAYLLGLTVLMVSMGRLADIIGKKRVFATGIVLFLIGSALCGLAMNIYLLIAFRFLQSVGAAMLLALGTAILTEVWPSYKRGQAIGFAAGFISLGIVIGPAIGGLMLQYLSWHWIFFVNVPIGALSFILVLLFVPPLRPSGNRESFDVAGAGTLGIGLLCLTLGITLGQTDGFTAPVVLVLFAVAAGLLALFAWLEMHVRYPMLDLSLFREAQFSLNLFTGTIVFVAISGVVLLLPFYLSLVLKLPLLQVGLYMAIVPLVMAVLQPMSGMLSDRMGTRRISTLGLFFILAGYLLMTTLPDSGSALAYVWRFLPVAIGMSLFNSPNNSAIMGSAPKNRLGIASAVLSTVRTLGQVIGVAVLGAFFYHSLAVHNGAPVDLEQASPQVITAAMHDQFWLVSLLISIALVTALLIWRWEIRHGLTRRPRENAPVAEVG
jgi:EmrB/QacA subfamily drug resistance transporter